MRRVTVALVLLASCKTPTPKGTSSLQDDGTPPPQPEPAGFACQEVKEIAGVGGGGKRFDCRIEHGEGTKTMHVLQLKGTFAETAEQHGYLMALEADRGPMRQIVQTLDKAKTGEGPKAKVAAAFVDCLVSTMEESVSEEFVAAVEAFHKGYTRRFQEEGKTPILGPGDRDKLMGASLAIELDNIVDGIKYRMAGTNQMKAQAAAEIVKACGKKLGSVALDEFENYVKSLRPDGKDPKFGCTGFVSPASSSKDGHFIHARNLDADLVLTWNEAPTVFLVQETGKIPYVSGATGGLVYAGGISGYNKNKITAALHQMYPEVYRFDHGGRNATIAPFLQQKILRDATSLTEAQAMIRTTGHFSAWTLQVGDARTNEVMSMEFATKGTDVARQTANKPMSQTNHFISPKTAPQARTPYYNKHLESRARMKVLDEAMAAKNGAIDLTFAIDQLASHQDAFEGLRSFGRTAVKGYGVLSTIAIPTKNEFWITLGERKPASHSTYVGFSIDLDQMTATPIGTQRVKLYDNTPNWERSLSTYIDSREAYNAEDMQRALTKLDAAIAEAEADAARLPEVPHIPYYYIRARLLGKVDKHQEAAAQWKKLLEPALYERVMDYQQALISMYAVVAHDKAGQAFPEAERKKKLDFAKSIFDKYYAQDKHPDLDKKAKLVAKLLAKQDPGELPTMDYITIE